ncbi:MAG: hypothetical protein Q7R70_07010 [Candidatus Diapherotrites archaeon]|nr:hypothetical protein [Candidatus Diapherotrites archaeon]
MILAALTTTIRLEKSVKKDLDSFKNSKKEPYSEVIRRLINSCKDDPLSDDEIKQIQESLEDVKAGRVLSWKQAKKEWGV